MKENETRQVENQLMVMGLRKLNDPELIRQMANIINVHPGYRDPHAFYMGLLGECEPDQRREMYNALLPHLKFAPWPLDKYVSAIAAPTAEAESRENPIEIGSKKVNIGGKEYAVVPEAEAEWCFLTLRCYKCTREEEFGGFTLVAAMQVARNAGWVRDIAEQKEICPKCPAVRLN